MIYAIQRLRFAFAACVASIATFTARSEIPEITKAQYEHLSDTNGIVLVSINWGRLWRVRGYQNAELRGIYFDMDGKAKSLSAKADLELEGPSGFLSRATTKPVFINYAILLPRGRYQMIGFDVKVAESVSSIYHIKPDRSLIMVDGQSKLGFFKVGAGETVYIGNFWLDGAQAPFIWRYYSPQGRSFEAHIAEFRQKYPFLPLGSVVYRLFDTSTIGMNYSSTSTPNQSTDPTPTTVTPVAGQPARQP